MLRIFSLFILLVSGSLLMAATPAMAEPMTEQQKIDGLLSAIDSPDITFIRNGKEHDGAWAKKHLADKMKDAKPAITTADDFITKIATTSSHTGKPYLIKTKDGKTVESAAWLQGKLADMNKPAAGTSDTGTSGTKTDTKQ